MDCLRASCSSSGKGRPKSLDAVWTLYPSTEFVDEIIEGNKEMKAHREVEGNKRESRLLPGFQEDPRPGEISAKVFAKRQGRGNKRERAGEIGAKDGRLTAASASQGGYC